MSTRKLLISFLLAVSLGIITCGSIFYFLGSKLLKSNISVKVQEVDAEFREVFTNQESLLTALTETIGNAPEIATALQKHDKDLLLRKYNGLFSQLNKTHGVTHFGFHLPDRTNLIRFHAPGISGDTIDRESLINAATTGLTSKGFEQGSTGNITLRVVKPIFADSKIIGFFELGTEIPSLLKKIQQNISVSYTILVNKRFLENKKWNERIERFPNQTEWDTLENFVVVGSSEGTLTQSLLSRIQQSARVEDLPSKDYFEISEGAFWKNYPLFDLERKEIGVILINGSVSGILDPLFKGFFFTGLISLGIAALLFYSSWKICTNLIQSNLVAVQSAQMSSLGEMASGLTHEITNPMTVISMCAAHLETLIDSEPLNKQASHELLARIERMVSKISKINAGMRLASRKGDADPMVPTSVRTLISDTLEICVDRLRMEQVELRIGEIPEQIISCRSSQISQVILNLLNNARDAVGGFNEKWVELKVEVQPEKLRILVTDSGKGIPKKVAAKMMSPFFTTKDLNKGTGLGLSISRKIISEHHGRLYYDPSTPNTCFVIELPVSLQKAS